MPVMPKEQIAEKLKKFEQENFIHHGFTFPFEYVEMNDSIIAAPRTTLLPNCVTKKYTIAPLPAERSKATIPQRRHVYRHGL